MNEQDYLLSLKTNSERLADACAMNPALPVQACPGWNAGNLAVHLWGVYAWVVGILETAAIDYERDVRQVRQRVNEERETLWADPQYATSSAAIDRLRTTSDQLRTLLTEKPPDTRIWTWWQPDQTVGFWQRRMAQETAVHRWDAEASQGIERPIDAELAADGIDEALSIHLPSEYEEAAPNGKGESYHFHCTDVDGEWLVRFEPDEILITREHGKGDLAFTGTASDLLLFVWRRVGEDRLTIHGDMSKLPRYYELLRVDS